MNYGSVGDTSNSFLPTAPSPSQGGLSSSDPPTSPNIDEKDLQDLRRWGLGSGIAYMVIIVCGIVAEVGIRGTLIEYSSPETTAENIRANPVGLRWSVVLEMIMATADVLVSIWFGLILCKIRSCWILVCSLWSLTPPVFSGSESWGRARLGRCDVWISTSPTGCHHCQLDPSSSGFHSFG